MQRDIDLVRKILFYVEENYVAGDPEIPVHIDGYSDSVVYEHCILMRNDGLIRYGQTQFGTGQNR